ncbi:hypothetical protein M446_1909 [Methylobacterium sp. 4-46]|nr:hypothetical protein M446_1909 [Methylobacterium sp. 4-46]
MVVVTAAPRASVRLLTISFGELITAGSDPCWAVEVGINDADLGRSGAPSGTPANCSALLPCEQTSMIQGQPPSSGVPMIVGARYRIASGIGPMLNSGLQQLEPAA